ncbi:hypothetical protein ASPWEDRAFT_43582 [Aspergillus wentii DTO 134E9]|uniref:Hydrophobin n=1 Tax=Aspergillus wentii DTO 134E9 TaxID=1073089 RepID=A0A1L9RFA6_ASPWE|nr:uncharacterized protein ASPWEDRAFT_43582 [Aspergillus wentii DTO 134E9]OJJ33553.1 hypothetical protein ASPWEDRAFT_43582 [Aspergillus wentii DTO 134E9]
MFRLLIFVILVYAIFICAAYPYPQGCSDNVCNPPPPTQPTALTRIRELLTRIANLLRSLA